MASTNDFACLSEQFSSDPYTNVNYMPTTAANYQVIEERAEQEGIDQTADLLGLQPIAARLSQLPQGRLLKAENISHRLCCSLPVEGCDDSTTYAPTAHDVVCLLKVKAEQLKQVLEKQYGITYARGSIGRQVFYLFSPLHR